MLDTLLSYECAAGGGAGAAGAAAAATARSRPPVVLFDVSRSSDDLAFAAFPSDEYVRRLAQDNSHRHMLDPDLEYGYAHSAGVAGADGGGGGGPGGDAGGKAWKRVSMTGLHLRDRARHWIGKLKKKARDAADARKRVKAAKAIARSNSARFFEGNNVAKNNNRAAGAAGNNARAKATLR
jgi:hypothetical protein